MADIFKEIEVEVAQVAWPGLCVQRLEDHAGGNSSEQIRRRV